MDYIDSDYDSDLDNLCIEVTEYAGHQFESGRYFFFPETNEMQQLINGKFEIVPILNDEKLNQKFFNLRDVMDKWAHVYLNQLKGLY